MKAKWAARSADHFALCKSLYCLYIKCYTMVIIYKYMFLSPRQMVDAMNIKPGSTLLDLGAGSGAYVYEACRVLGSSGKVIAVDIDQEKLKLVKDTAKVGGFIIDTLFADLDNKLVLPDFSVDYIILANTLFMIENKQGLINECARVLAPAGQLLFVEWQKKSLLGPSEELLIDREKALEMFTKAGFRKNKELPAGDYHYSYILSL